MKIALCIEYHADLWKTTGYISVKVWIGKDISAVLFQEMPSHQIEAYISQVV